ncbi:hypothetical protein LLB_3725 [Legionella longbeachae D-4968]|nr:hypothetical protein LLB_3725 [Legionella longbeachae D-4968]
MIAKLKNKIPLITGSTKSIGLLQKGLYCNVTGRLSKSEEYDEYLY